MPKYVNENLDGRITPEFYRADKDLDIIFLGSSTVYNAIIPAKLYEDLGQKVYLRANASQTLWQSYYLLEDALLDHSPRLVALDVSFMKNGEEFIEEPSNRKAIEGMRPSLSKLKAIEASQYEEEHAESYFFPVYRYHSRWKELKAEDFKYLFYIPNVTDNGYIRNDAVATNQQLYDIDPEMENALKLKLEGNYDDIRATGVFPDKAVDYLDRIVLLCKEKNIPLLLFKTPTYVNSWYGAYDEWLDRYAEENAISYVNYDDYKDEIGLVVEKDYSDDGSHLNHVGASKFTAFIESDDHLFTQN